MKNAKGFVIITTRDAETLEIKNVQEQENAITVGMFLRNIMADAGSQSNWRGTSNNLAPCNIAISSRIVHPSVKTTTRRATGFTASEYPNDPTLYPTTDNSFRDLQDIEVQDWTMVSGNPTYAEYIGRFNPPASSRTINSIFMTGQNSDSDASTIVKLNVPCIQNPGEVLDITYRIQFFTQPSNGSNQINISPIFTDNGIIAKSLTGDEDAPFPTFANSRFISTPSTDNIIATMVQQDSRLNNTGTFNERINRFSHYKSEFNKHLEKDDLNGSIIRSVGYGSEDNGLISPTVTINDDIFNSQLIWADFTPDDFAFKPIQPIQNHNKNAIEWGLDVDFLASGQGSISIDGSGWTQQDWPEFWRVECSESGEVGTSKYFFRTRPLIGFDGISYQPRDEILTDFWTSFDNPNRTTIENAHGIRDPLRVEEYGPDSIIRWDSSGITLMFINESKAYSFDSNTSPQLPVNSVRQVAVDSNGSIWVACRSTGLYRIDNPDDPQATIITQLTEANNALSTGTATTCYGVAVGYNDSIWAIFDGALSKTSNPTDATPTFVNYTPTSTTQFEYIGLTDGNWSAIKYIRADRNSPDDQLAIVFNSLNRDQIVWWSTAGTAIAGPLGSSLFDSSKILSENADQYGYLNISQRGNLWTWISSLSSSKFTSVEWGESSTTVIGIWNQDTGSTPKYTYDYYDNPNIMGYVSIRSASNQTLYGIGLTNPDGYNFTNAEAFTPFSAHGIPHSFEHERGNSVVIVSPSRFGGFDEFTTNPFRIFQPAPRSTMQNDALNGEHSASQEMVWNKWHWNGSAWEKDYYQDAIDTASFASGPFPANRHNFNTEDHYFTGRSMIDVSNSFSSGNFGTIADATFVFSVQANEKLVSQTSTSFRENGEKFQEWERCIFDFSTPTRQFKLLWDDGIQSDMVLYEDGNPTAITTTPANLQTGFDRLVVILNGSSVDLYLNNVQIGNTITLANGPLDLSNVNNDLSAFIGSRVYKWDYNQRYTPWQSEFFRGRMENIQLWNIAWSATDVANDFADINGVIISQPSSNLVSRLELTEAINETKPTHTANENLIDGVSVEFSNGQNPTAFVAGDYYTFGVVDGILKDNSLSMRQQFSLYWKPVNFEFNTFKNTTDGDVVDSVSTFNVTEAAAFERNESVMADSVDPTSPVGLELLDIPGQLGSNTVTNWGYGSGSRNQTGADAMQPIITDGFVEVMNGFNNNTGFVGLTDNPSAAIFSNSSILFQIGYGLSFNPIGTVDVYESGTLVSSAVTTFTVEDKFRIRRTGTVITYEKEDNANNVTVLYTSTVASSGILQPRVMLNKEGCAFCEIKVNYNRPAHLMSIGDPLTLTGSFDPNFLRVEVLDTSTIKIQLDGIDAPINVSELIYSDMQIPAPGEITINGKTGWLLFNPVDVGKSVTGTVSIIYDQ